MRFDREQRLRDLPQPTYPDALPVVAKREEIDHLLNVLESAIGSADAAI